MNTASRIAAHYREAARKALSHLDQVTDPDAREMILANCIWDAALDAHLAGGVAAAAKVSEWTI